MSDAQGTNTARDDETMDENVCVRAQRSRGVVAIGIRSPGARLTRLLSTHLHT